MGDNEKKKLLEHSDSPPYGSGEPEAQSASPSKLKDGHINSPLSSYSSSSSGPVLTFFERHKNSIPGYGMLQMVKSSSIYALYVLFILLLVYLMNQLDRYTLPIVTTSAGYDLHYGDIYCIKNRQVNQSLFKEYNITTNITGICGNETYYDEFLNETLNVK